MPVIRSPQLFLFTIHGYVGFKRNFLETCGHRKYKCLGDKRHDILTNFDIRFKNRIKYSNWKGYIR